MENNNGCLICGEELVYSADYHSVECYYCKGTFQSNVTCSKGHYVCDKCHAQTGIEQIETYCLSSNSVNPLEMASAIMQSDKIKMHGPEHHFLVPAVLIAAYCNKTNDQSKSAKTLNRTEKGRKDIGRFLWYSWDLRSRGRNRDFYQHHHARNTTFKGGMGTE